MCSMASSCGFNIFSQHDEASDGVPLKAILESQRKSWTAHKRLSFVNLWYASCGCWCISSLRRYHRCGEQKTKEHFQLGLGESVRLHSFAFLSASRSVSHLTSWVFTLWLRLGCPHTSLKTHLAQPLTTLGCFSIIQLQFLNYWI